MRWPGGVARVVEENDHRILVWKPEGKRAPLVYQLVCHIVWRRTEFRLVPLRPALALQRRPRRTQWTGMLLRALQIKNPFVFSSVGS